MSRLVLVHGSVGNGESSWSAQKSLDQTREILILNRPGFPPGPLVERVDFEEHGDWVANQLRSGDHLCGHSYGGVVSLYAASQRSDLASLTVIEPPAFGLAAQDPKVSQFISSLKQHWSSASRDPRDFLMGFYALIAGREVELPNPLPPDLEQGARILMVERGPWEAQPPLEKIKANGTPSLVVSGGWNHCFNAVCKIISEKLNSREACHVGNGHNPQFISDFNNTFIKFIDAIEERR